MASFFTDLFGVDDEFNKRERLEHAYAHEDEIDFKPKRRTVTKPSVSSEAKKQPPMVQLHPPIDKVHLKNEGDVTTCVNDTSIDVGSSTLEVKEVSEDKGNTGEHLYKAEVTKDDDVIGQAVVYTKDTEPIPVQDDQPVVAKKKSFCKTPYFMDEAMYRQRVRELAGGKANALSDDDEEGEGFNILDLETPLGDLDLGTGGESHEIIDFNTPIVRTRVGNKKDHHLVGVDTPIAGVHAGGDLAGVDTPVASTYLSTTRGDLFGLDTSIGGVHAGGSLVGVDTPIASVHAGCHKCKSTTRAECKCPKKSAYGKKSYGKMYAAGRYDNLSTEKRKFLNYLQEVNDHSTQAMLEISQRPVTDRERHMLDLYSDIIRLVHDTMVVANRLEESKIPDEEKKFKRQLADINRTLKEVADPNNREYASGKYKHPHDLKNKKEELIEKSLQFQSKYKSEVNEDIRSLDENKRKKAMELEKRISSQFEMFRNDVKQAKSFDEIQNLETHKYFGKEGMITKLKKKLDNLIVS